MTRRHLWLAPGWIFALLLAGTSCTSSRDPASAQADQIEELRRLERERLQSLVSADVATARRLHADDFQLINPAGTAISKAEYLGQIESGQLDYRGWEAGEIVVRLYQDAAVIRYRDTRFDVDWEGQPVQRGPMVHTNLYERRGEQWQVVWSQASGVMTPSPQP